MAVITKSNHPVEVKRIEVHVWSLRDEIEHALTVRKEECDKNGTEFVYDDIQAFYSRPSRFRYFMELEADPDAAEEMQAEGNNENVDSSGNPLDDDAAAMMAALSGGDESEEEAPEVEAKADDAETPAEEDAEAAKLAAEMLGDQGGSADDEAAKLAAEMLGDQASESSAENQKKVSATRNELSYANRSKPVGDKVIKGFTLLSDMNMKFLLIFARDKFTPGTSIVVEYQIPNKIILSAELIDFKALNLKSRVISDTRPNFRLHTIFTYIHEGERSALRDFLTSVEPKIPSNIKKLARASKDDDDDMDFDDLGL